MNQLLLVIGGAGLGVSVISMITLSEGFWLGVTSVGLILMGWRR